jgi:hypothetical protein
MLVQRLSTRQDARISARIIPVGRDVDERTGPALTRLCRLRQQIFNYPSRSPRLAAACSHSTPPGRVVRGMTTSLITKQLRQPPTTPTPADAHEAQMLLGCCAMVATRPETERPPIVAGVINARTGTANATIKDIRRTGCRFLTSDRHNVPSLGTYQGQMPSISLPERPSCGASSPGVRTTQEQLFGPLNPTMLVRAHRVQASAQEAPTSARPPRRPGPQPKNQTLFAACHESAEGPLRTDVAGLTA